MKYPMTTTRYRIECQRTLNKRWMGLSLTSTPEAARSVFYQMWHNSGWFRCNLYGKIRKTRLVKITEIKEVISI